MKGFIYFEALSSFANWIIIILVMPIVQNRPVKEISFTERQCYNHTSQVCQKKSTILKHQSVSVNTKLKRLYHIVGRNQCKLKMNSSGFVYGKRAEYLGVQNSSNDDLFWFLPVGPNLVFIRSASNNRWLCVNGRKFQGQIGRNRRACLFTRNRAVIKGRDIQWDHLGLYNSKTHLRVAWFPSMGSFCSAQAINVKSWDEIKNPDFFAFLTADSNIQNTQFPILNHGFSPVSLKKSKVLIPKFNQVNMTKRSNTKTLFKNKWQSKKDYKNFQISKLINHRTRGKRRNRKKQIHVQNKKAKLLMYRNRIKSIN